jgi:UMF1 family MFS transporter
LNNDDRVTKREIFSWCMYDFANSSYTTLIVTVAFSIYFINVVADGAQGERLWAWGYSLSMLLFGLIAPFLGAVADQGGFKKRFLVGFTLLSVFATAALFLVEKGDIAAAMLIFTLSNIGFNGGVHFYNSFLIDIADRTNMGRISGYGWALGYVGGLLCLVLAYPLIKGGFGEGNLVNYRLSFPLTGAFFLAASIPTFVFLKERVTRQRVKTAYFSSGLRRVVNTFHEIKRFRELVKYFFGYLIYTDGINTVIVFSAVFANRVLGFTPAELFVYFIITQISAGLGALVFGPVTDRLGAKRSISITLVIWIAVSVWAYMVETKTGFYILGVVAGSALGSNQSASRTLLGLFTPHGKNAEFFGFFALVGKFAAVIGPLAYGEITAATGNQRVAVLSLALFFIAGLAALLFVDEKKGIAAAEAYEKFTKQGD